MNGDTAMDIGLLFAGIYGGIVIGMVIDIAIFDKEELIEERLKLMEMCHNEIFYNSDSNYKKCDLIGVVPQ